MCGFHSRQETFCIKCIELALHFYCFRLLLFFVSRLLACFVIENGKIHSNSVFLLVYYGNERVLCNNFFSTEQWFGCLKPNGVCERKKTMLLLNKSPKECSSTNVLGCVFFIWFIHSFRSTETTARIGQFHRFHSHLYGAYVTTFFSHSHAPHLYAHSMQCFCSG